MHQIPDSLLANKISTGNKDAFDKLFFKYYKTLYRFALSYCNNKEIAQESVQSTFIKIWKNKSDNSLIENIGKMLFIYTKNNVIDEVRKETTRKKYEASISINLNEDYSIHDDSKDIAKAILETSIEKLPKKAKEIFRLAKQEGLTISEIAEYLNISNKTVENQLTIAYKKLRIYLEPFKNQLDY